MSIYVISGDPGAGKSAYCVPLAEKFVKNDPRPICSTFWMDVPGVEVMTWPEMCRQEGAVCFVDEAADMFHSRDFNKAENKAQLQLFREHRKDGLTLFLVSQSYKMLDTNIRDMVRYVWHIKRLFGPDFYENETRLEKLIGVWSLGQMYLAKSYQSETEGHKRRIRKTWFLFRVDSLYDRFDTLAKSQGLSGTKRARGAGLAAGSALAADRRRARALAQKQKRLPDFIYPLVGVPVPAPLAPAEMPFTQEEYYAWTRPLGGSAQNGTTVWTGPGNVAGYDLLPEELQVHRVGVK